MAAAKDAELLDSGIGKSSHRPLLIAAVTTTVTATRGS